VLTGDDKYLRGDIDRKTPIPLSRWLSRLDDWARFGSLDDYMEPERQTAPWAFQEFALEHYQKGTHYSFAQWDSDAPVLPMWSIA